MNALPLTPTLSPQAGRGRKVPSLRRSGERVGVRGALICTIALSLALAGCGKKNAPQPPPDVPNTYPRSYPSE
jgi:hypothetical protein